MNVPRRGRLERFLDIILTGESLSQVEGGIAVYESSHDDLCLHRAARPPASHLASEWPGVHVDRFHHAAAAAPWTSVRAEAVARLRAWGEGLSGPAARWLLTANHVADFFVGNWLAGEFASRGRGACILERGLGVTLEVHRAGGICPEGESNHRIRRSAL
ncbi:hypothetical protein GUITHDRAFT_152995, partial [Guillardia theta CCMP2712]